MDLFEFGVIYVIGYILNLIGLIKFGKRLGYDYEKPKSNNYWDDDDDFDDNATAYLCLSIIWPFFILINLGGFGIKALVKFVGTFIK